MDIVVTEWALDSYLNLKHTKAFTNDEYKNTIRPDVELLRDGLPSLHAQFQNSKFWGPATDMGGKVIQYGHKMKWHNIGSGRIQLRLAIVILQGKSFLCQGYVKSSDFVDKKEMAKLKNRIRDISPEQQIKVYEIATAMKNAGLGSLFITDCVKHALEYEGTHDLMVLWVEASSQAEKDEVVVELQDEIDMHLERPKKPMKKPYIRFDDLEGIAKNIEGFKKSLRRVVDRQGGITELAKKTGIPQPSLSRFFSSQSMPRRTTLYKLADALGLSEDQIITDWVA